MKTLSVTFLTFSPDGKELLVNLGGEQLYLFDLDGKNLEAKIKFNSYKEMFEQEFKNLEADSIAQAELQQHSMETRESTESLAKSTNDSKK